MNGYVRELSERDKLHNEIVACKRFLLIFPKNPWYTNRLVELEARQDAMELEEDLMWLGQLPYRDLLDMYYMNLDLSQGSICEWWERIQEEPF